MQKTIGGNRLGSGKKQKVTLKSYERSTHDLSYIWRSTMASGTLVPFMSEIGLPGDTLDIRLDCDIKTHPTIGPLFGSYKVQLDVFMVPFRLYQAYANINKLGIGLDMSKVKIPQIKMEADSPNFELGDIDNSQINPSCIFSYLNIRGLGVEPDSGVVKRDFNAVPYIGYWDIYKNYYANKSEGIGAVIHAGRVVQNNVSSVTYTIGGVGGTIPAVIGTTETLTFEIGDTILISPTTGTVSEFDLVLNTQSGVVRFSDFGGSWEDFGVGGRLWKCSSVTGFDIGYWSYAVNNELFDEVPNVTTFTLSNIDVLLEDLRAAAAPVAYPIDDFAIAPFGLPLLKKGTRYTKLVSQEGLALKTYQSDLFNNWMSTEWIDGNDGINDITRIDTTSGSFKIDTLILSKKVYNMLNRIAISGGTMEDWMETVYDHEGIGRVNTPVYMGGLSKELVFQEVVSNSATSGDNSQPLGTLAGRGVMSGKNKGGNVRVSVNEPCYVMGIISLTPRVDYSQGNKWDVNLETWDDFHKPALDEIGFQDLITDQMAWFDTVKDGVNPPVFKSAGKVPSWINYMTNVNQVRGNFAVRDNEMFMTLNRRYEQMGLGGIKDLTTYIDPVKFNNIFAETARDAQNFWAQIAVDITARRKMSAKVMPNM